MKLVWCPESASKAYIDTVKSCEVFEESSVAELVSAMAGGWKPQLIVETWFHGGVITTSVGLAVASRHICGRHVCVVPNEQAKLDYIEEMRKACNICPEVIVGEVEQVMTRLIGIDFLVVDCRRKDFATTLSLAQLSNRGAVLICKNSTARSLNFRWRSVVDGGSRIVRSANLPVGKGLEIAYVATGSSKGLSPGKATTRWVRHIDQLSGEEHVYRR
ncbi:ankyrin repeat/KH domain protein [Thalictrum thalictroides]|uniref:Ankyrin repeat/KH domain protein n=1 Tax=Thalictrum thalictroides TaxID=46969 RepID=A0A7J6XC27_THATH|nr:ankyrin repeat/KH domain protein [Thalictrum thalictroides]